MNGLLMMIIAIVVLGGAYLIYGRYLAKTWGIDPKAKTPAYELEDGVDYVPADTNVVFGHQFASIAGAGPINGPIQAAIFGWVPVLLWVLIGGVFFGAVATTSMIFIVEAVALGFLLRYGKLHKWVNTAIAIVMLIGAIVLGLYFPMYISQSTWHIIVFIYVLIASVAPVWALLQPRDYLNSYLLVACAVFLKRTKRKGFMLWIPMVVMIAVTFSALGMTIWQLTSGLIDGTYAWISGMTTMVNGASVLTAWGACLQLVFAVLILALGVVVVIQGVKKLFGKEETVSAAA